VTVLEDLQSADPPSLRLLEHLAFEAASEPILVLASVREEFRERGHPLDRTLGVLRQHERTVELALGGFSRREVAALLARTLGRSAPSDLISELFVRREGVPLFLREVIRLLAERGVLEQPEKIPRSGIALPGRALDLIRRAFDALSDPARSLVASRRCSVASSLWSTRPRGRACSRRRPTPPRASVSPTRSSTRQPTPDSRPASAYACTCARRSGSSAITRATSAP